MPPASDQPTPGTLHHVERWVPDLNRSIASWGRGGLNRLAFHVVNHHQVDTLVAEAPRRGWRLLFPDTHPYAGGDHHYAAYLEDTDGFGVELAAMTAPGT